MNWKETVWRNRKGASTLEYVVVITAAIILAMALYHTLTGGDVKASIQERVAAAFQLKGGAPPGSPQAQPSDQPANQTSDQKKPAEAPPTAPKPEEKSTGEKIVSGVLDFVGYNDVKAAITGKDENGNKVGVGERIFRGALALPIAKPVKGVKMATKYGDDVLAVGKKKFDDIARKGKKTACACPKINLPTLKPIPSNKLQKKFKHAGDFGVSGNYNKSNAKAFEEAIQNHVSKAKSVYKSTYRNPKDVYVYLKDDLAVLIDMNGNFVSGWRLSPKQLEHHTTNGVKVK